MTLNSEAWIKRADEIIAKGVSAKRAIATEAIQFATSMLTTLYGPRSTQLERFSAGCDAISRGTGNVCPELCHHAYGAIASAKAELQAGLVGSLRLQVTGEVLAELLVLGKETLDEGTDTAKNVGAVMIAAAYEDLVRRMGSELAGVAGRPKLEEVIIALKNADVLKGGEVGTAQSYLKFRNDSLHADWAKVQQSQVQSCIAFIEALLVRHFS